MAPNTGAMQDDPFRERLKRLEERIEAAQRPAAKPGRGKYSVEGAELGWRMVTELLTGIGFGFVLGYGLDSLLGTLPLFLVVFVLLGFAAGVRIMMRSAEELKRRGAAGREAVDEAGAEPAKSGKDAPNGRPRD